jgi:hypothetical protein
MMPLRITVSNASRAAELLAFLREWGGAAGRESDNAITVARRHAVVPGEPPYQHRVEIEFVVRAWARQRPDAQYQVEEANSVSAGC